MSEPLFSSDIDTLEAGVLAGERTALGRAITLVESTRPHDRRRAQELLARLLPKTGAALRIGITGVPGVGKSTLIEALGTRLTGAGHGVAVLAVDPSSVRSGGSILGDKTRMERLAADPGAFIRPSPSAGMLGGVARATREAMLVSEAAGFDRVIVETVGAGQSEHVVAGMVDVFIVLLLPGGGDELQGIKKGVLELADILVVTKADRDAAAVRRALRDYRAALRLVTPSGTPWTPPVLAVSAQTGEGLEEFMEAIAAHQAAMAATGEFEAKRRRQRVRWMWDIVEDRLVARFRADAAVARLLPRLAAEVEAGDIPPGLAAERLLEAFTGTGEEEKETP